MKVSISKVTVTKIGKIFSGIIIQNDGLALNMDYSPRRAELSFVL